MPKTKLGVMTVERWEKLHLLGMVLVGPVLMTLLGFLYFGFLYRPL